MHKGEVSPQHIANKILETDFGILNFDFFIEIEFQVTSEVVDKLIFHLVVFLHHFVFCYVLQLVIDTVNVFVVCLQVFFWVFGVILLEKIEQMIDLVWSWQFILGKYSKRQVKPLFVVHIHLNEMDNAFHRL